MDETNRDASQCGRGVSQFMLDDLQLAAELGKTLLERNKELEIFLKEYKCKGDEQEREIVHLRKHINAMTEVNDSRLKVYEQLEVGIQDLERANQRLIIEKNSDKKQIKTISSNTEILESRCEELSQLLNESKQALSIERRKSDRLQQELNSSMPLTDKKIGDHSDQRNKKVKNLKPAF
ncbi:cerebellar degeneration-related protein 2-like isoform X9 [Drosophila miranda]|uniref:cerebellar degeneration-related protein 2-like isoform X9 n=1 Tax=Drosophila miranda TaxID=7229 RepID=UPI00143F0EC2|nr:cerebellar degeneration-related protein 2-like isoform X9 [Drosophila miranda]